MDEITRQFMDIVSCKPYEVLATPKLPSAALAGCHVLDFGRWRGEAIRDVPASYLYWLIEQPPFSRKKYGSRAVRRCETAKRLARIYLDGGA